MLSKIDLIFLPVAFELLVANALDLRFPIAIVKMVGVHASDNLYA